MTIVPTRLTNPVLLTNSASTQFTCPANSIAFVQSVNFSNTDTTNHTITAYLVPNGGTIGAAVALINNQSITGKQSYQAPELRGAVLNTGDTIQCLADTSGVVNVTINGFLMGSSGT
jgi:hypothetical protein